MAEISLKVKSDFEQAKADFKNLGNVSAEAAKQIAKFQESFDKDSIDEFIAKNKLAAIGVQATQGKMAAATAEIKGLEKEMKKLVSQGLDPASAEFNKLETELEQARDEFNKLKSAADKVKLSGVVKETKEAESGFKSLLKSAASVGLGLGMYDIANKLIDIGSAAIRASAAMEQNRVAFTTMLGSAQASQQLLTQIQDFAASTPFQFNELVDASKRMIAFGFSAEEVTEKLGMIGDVSAGLGQPIGDMIYLFGQVKTQGRAMTQDLNQFANRGVPIFDEVAKAMGVTKDQVKKLAEEGKITYDVIEKAFQNMTGAGGKFGGLMEAQSATLAGKWSNFNDGLDKTLVLLGDRLAPTAKNALSVMSMMVTSLNRMLEENQKVAQSTAHMPSILEQNLKLMDGTVDKLRYMVELRNSDSKEAMLYLGYLSGNVKLNDKQIQQLEERLKLNRSINDIAYEANKNELESWRQRGLVVAAAKEKTAEKSPKGVGAGTKKSEEQIFQDRLNVMQNMEALHYAERQKMAEDFFTKKLELEKINGEELAAWRDEQVTLIANNDKLSYEQKLEAMSALEKATIKHNQNMTKNYGQFAKSVIDSTSSALTDINQTMKNLGHNSMIMAVALKGVAAAQAAVNSYLAYTQVLAAPDIWPTWARPIMAKATLIAGLAAQARILTTPISAQTGLTSYEVPDIRQNRNDGAPVRAQAGETVTVTPRGESAMGVTSVSIKIGEAELFSIIQRGINTGEISVTSNNIGRGVFAN